eukprot:COSAG01_NODE_924_length_12710_cov_10.895567_8_plen_265_part_00
MQQEAGFTVPSPQPGSQPASARSGRWPRPGIAMAWRVLTVGDGDLSYSLGLARCYGGSIELTATTLVTEKQLLASYARGAAHLCELRQRGVRVLHGVDATALLGGDGGDGVLGPWARCYYHCVVFNHPHLGPASDPREGEAVHRRRHASLIAHFIHSAAPLLCDGRGTGVDGEGVARGSIFLTLSGTQGHTWRVMEAAARAGLVSAGHMPTTRPPLLLPSRTEESGDEWSEQQGLGPPLPAHPGWAARRKYRNGSLGSRHWLGK